MAVILNTLSSIGDILYIYSQGAVAGNVGLTGYTDSLVGVTATRFFNKTFRYSLDGVNYSAWLPLTNPNLALVTGNVPGLIFFEFRYERAGTDTTGLLEFDGIQLNGNIIIQINNNTTTLQSIFADLVNNNMLTASICNNLLKKIYKSGILPKFIDRGEGVDDTDFVSLWSAICYFLAMCSAYTNEFDQILYKRKYLVEYLKERNMSLSEDQIPFEDLQFLANNFYDEIRKRGTQLTYRKKSIDIDILKLDFVGTNGSTVFLEDSGKIMTPHGSAQISTNDYVSAPSSGLFNGTTDFLSTPYIPKFDLSNCNFLIEADFNASSFATQMAIVSKDTYGTNIDWNLIILNDHQIGIYTNATIDTLVVTVPKMNPGQWYNFRVIRQHGVNRIYLDGVLYGQNTMLITNASLTPITVGCIGFSSPHWFFNGYIDNLRVSRIDPLETRTDGEWLRLLCRNPYDEFLVDVIQKEKSGFCVGNSSPLYNGTYFSPQINKTEENTQDFIDLSKYDLLNYPNVSIVNDGGLNVAKLQGGAGLTGFGADLLHPPNAWLPYQLIIVDKTIDYEITFQIKRISGSGSINFGVIGYNRNEQLKPLSFRRIDTGAITNTFLTDPLQKVTKITDQWYSVRGIIYSSVSSVTVTGQAAKLNVGQGINLKFNGKQDVEKVKICLYLDSLNAGDVYHIYDFKMRPLIRGTNILISKTGVNGVTNPQFLQCNDIILNWRRNNNQNLDDYQIQNFIEDFLIPYQKRLVQYPLEPKINDKQLLLVIN